jgi:glycosylphosphatidylinositol transamidase
LHHRILKLPVSSILKTVNKDGISILLAFADFCSSIRKFIAEYSFWSKDIIFLITDQGHFGAHAWLEAYHGLDPSPGTF